MAALRSSDGAILDPDDRLADVADDREQLAACLASDEPETGRGLGLRGDGTSASSNSGSPSPDFLQRERYIRPPPALPASAAAQRKDMIEVTGQELVGADLLHVRRGSEPALNRLSPVPGQTLPTAVHQSTPHHDYAKVSFSFHLALFIYPSPFTRIIQSTLMQSNFMTSTSDHRQSDINFFAGFDFPIHSIELIESTLMS